MVSPELTQSFLLTTEALAIGIPLLLKSRNPYRNYKPPQETQPPQRPSTSVTYTNMPDNMNLPITNKVLSDSRSGGLGGALKRMFVPVHVPKIPADIPDDVSSQIPETPKSQAIYGEQISEADYKKIRDQYEKSEASPAEQGSASFFSIDYEVHVNIKRKKRRW